MGLSKIRGNTYYIHGATNIGVYTYKNKNCVLIDTGINNTVARRIEKILIENGLHPKYIINTHSHLDHCGGNSYFLENYPGCILYGSKKEAIFMENPEFVPYTLFASHGLKDMQTMKKPIEVDYILEYGMNKIDNDKFTILSLKGHSIEQIGIVTGNKVCFLGDSMFSEDILGKYSLPYLYSVEDFLKTLSSIGDIDADCFVLSHSDHIYSRDEIGVLADKNIKNVESYCDICLTLLEQPLSREALLRSIAILKELPMDGIQYYINLSAISAFISYLYNRGEIESFMEDGTMYYYV